MKILCAPTSAIGRSPSAEMCIDLYGRGQGSIGGSITGVVRRMKLDPIGRAWDLLSLSLAVVGTDLRVPRNNSADGWTRTLDLRIAVNDPEFWNSQRETIAQMLQFLTTDDWDIRFFKGIFEPKTETQSGWHDQDSVVLLSGGLDSLIGAIDLVSGLGKNPLAVSQIAQGDKTTQRKFASIIGNGLRHLQLNHNAKHSGPREPSQRARSLIFLSYGVLAGTALSAHRDGDVVTLYVCENGFISLNPPLTGSRIGSLSTRTTHPFFLRTFEHILSNAGIRIRVVNPYQFATKGEMLQGCSDHGLINAYASESTSCGRYGRHGYKHCGRCTPCLIRRAAFLAARVPDHTRYVYSDLSPDDRAHARFDDVRSAAMAVASVDIEGISSWARSALSTTLLGDTTQYTDLARRGVHELGSFLKAAKVS